VLAVMPLLLHNNCAASNVLEANCAAHMWAGPSNVEGQYKPVLGRQATHCLAWFEGIW
jgi:hypothetical protein